MNIKEQDPVLSIGVASSILQVHPRTLRIYEKWGLIQTHKKYGRRLFSSQDLSWIQCLRSLIHERNINIEALKLLLDYVPCWKIKNCSDDIRKNCQKAKNDIKKCKDFAQKLCKQCCQNCNLIN